MNLVPILFYVSCVIFRAEAFSNDVHTNQVPSNTSNINKKKLVCYYANWSQYRPEIGQFQPEDIDPFLCTHLIFAFGWMKKGRLVAFDESDEDSEDSKGTYSRVIATKRKNPGLKILLSIGGWSFGTQRFKDMTASRYRRQRFIYGSIEFLRSRGFDGLDIDWEFPRGDDDKHNFARFIQEANEAFLDEWKEKKQDRLLLTAAVPALKNTIEYGYDVPTMAKYLDFINVMSYDLHGKWENQTGHNSPLYATSVTEEGKQYCVEYVAKMWEKGGFPKQKIVIGLPTYGRSFTLADPEENGMNSPAVGGGIPGPYTEEPGFLVYYEVCEIINKTNATYVWDDQQKIPYVYNGNQWIGFDDERSLREKVRWILANGYGGAMVWTIDMDDFRGLTCGKGTYPLIRSVKDELARDMSSSSLLYTVTEQPAQLTKRKAPMLPDMEPRNDVELRQSSLEDKVVIADPETNAHIVCYYTNWSHRRPGYGRFVPEYIDPFLCTHIIFAFAAIENSNLIPTSSLDITSENRTGLYDRILNLKKKNPSLKVLLCVGGWILGPEPFQYVTETHYRQMAFILNTIEVLRETGFDGLDVDWEFPLGNRQKEKYSLLIKELYLAFEEEAESSELPRLLLSVAVPASSDTIAAGYDVFEINKYVDMFNVLSYDFHGDWENKVGHNSPLYPMKDASSHQIRLTVKHGVSEWVRRGAEKEKINVGVAAYGRTFTLANASSNDIGDLATAGGRPGKYTREAGFLAFYEICDFLKSSATLVWDDEQMVPYAYKDDQWVGFDDMRSLTEKTKWVREEGLGGVMLWSVDMDDFRGTCIGKPFPLVQAVRTALRGYVIERIIDEGSSTVDNSVDTDEVTCEESDGQISYYPDMSDCKRYYMCEGIRRHRMSCPADLVFNTEGDVCDWPDNVQDCKPA